MSARRIKQLFLFLFTVVTVANVNAQPGKWGVSFTPAFMAANTPQYAIQAGVEYRITGKLSLLTELAIRTGARKDSSEYNARHFRIKPELRYIFTHRPSNVQYYAGVQLSYSFRKWEELKGGFYFTDQLYKDSAISYDQARLSSPVFTASLQHGVLISGGRHFSIDIFYGVGVRVIDTHYADLVNTSKSYYMRPACRIIPSPDPAYWVNGTVTRFHMNTGLRLSWWF